MEARFTWVLYTQAERQRTEDCVARLRALAARLENEIDALVANTEWADQDVAEMIQILRHARKSRA